MAGTRKIAAILVADIVGYSRLAGADEERTQSRLRGLRSDLIDPAINAHHGRIVNRTGDGSLIEFRGVVDAKLNTTWRARARLRAAFSSLRANRQAGKPMAPSYSYRRAMEGIICSRADGCSY